MSLVQKEKRENVDLQVRRECPGNPAHLVSLVNQVKWVRRVNKGLKAIKVPQETRASVISQECLITRDRNQNPVKLVIPVM